MNHFDNIFNNVGLDFSEFPGLREKTTVYLNNLKNSVISNDSKEINSKNILTFISLQISLFDKNYEDLEFHIKLKLLLIVFSRYVDKNLVMKRFQNFDPEINIENFKSAKSYIFG